LKCACGFVVAIALLFLPSIVFAQTEKRIALLIGNKDYKAGVGALTNPLNDVRIVGEALSAIGFEVMMPIENATRAVMLRANLKFADKLKLAGPDAVGFLYYSGHGISSGGENYLIPVDVDENTSGCTRGHASRVGRNGPSFEPWDAATIADRGSRPNG
jgi:caspase domain-containing protein